MSKDQESYLPDINNVETEISQQKKKYVDAESGEIIYVDGIDKRMNGQKNFWKVYLMDYLTILGIIDSKQLDIFIYIAENTSPSNNLFIGTYKKIAEDVGASSATISKIMKKLQKNNFIKRVQNGVWFVNPNITMKGGERKRQILLSYYADDTPSQNTNAVGKMKVTRAQQKEIPKIEETLEQRRVKDITNEHEEGGGMIE